MKKDVLIEEIRDIRKQISKAYGHNTQRLIRHYQELERREPGRLLPPPPSGLPQDAPLPQKKKTAAR